MLAGSAISKLVDGVGAFVYQGSRRLQVVAEKSSQRSDPSSGPGWSSETTAAALLQRRRRHLTLGSPLGGPRSNRARLQDEPQPGSGADTFLKRHGGTWPGPSSATFDGSSAISRWIDVESATRSLSQAVQPDHTPDILEGPESAAAATMACLGFYPEQTPGARVAGSGYVPSDRDRARGPEAPFVRRTTTTQVPRYRYRTGVDRGATVLAAATCAIDR